MNEFRDKVVQLLAASTTEQLIEKRKTCGDKDIRKMINEELRKRGENPMIIGWKVAMKGDK